MLRITLAINGGVVGDYEVRRTKTDPNDVHTYGVREIKGGMVGPELLSLSHYYGDGARELAQRVLSQLERRQVMKPLGWD